MQKELQVTFATLTDRGERTVNEDSLGTSKNSFFVLCDGLGGHGSGEVASALVVDKMIESYERGKSLEEGIMFSQEKLLERQHLEGAEDSMKTTVVCLEIKGDTASFLHVGDSRAYLFEKGNFRQRTIDHSVPQMLVQRGDIQEKDIRHHEDRSRLLRVMGTEWNSPKYCVEKDIRLGRKTSFLLCSDGFWEWITEKEMSNLLKKAATPEEWLLSMEQVVRKEGMGSNLDNYSAVAVFVR